MDVLKITDAQVMKNKNNKAKQSKQNQEGSTISLYADMKPTGRIMVVEGKAFFLYLNFHVSIGHVENRISTYKYYTHYFR